jgi:putative DNA methylase
VIDDKRLIEDYLPIEAISVEASREKSVRKGHISTLHLWWARRPLVACRAAVYGALVTASRFVPNANSDEKKKSLGRANAAKFVTGLCKYPGSPLAIREAQHHILAAHAERLSLEVAEWKAGKSEKPSWIDEFKFSDNAVTESDITANRAPRPRVLDMFAGGGAIPLEALRLGCEAYSLDLNPVAHIIELCTLVYPQKYGKPDESAPGMTGTKGKDAQPTWGGLAREVHYWGEWVQEKVKAEIGDLYPLVPDPSFKGKRQEIQSDWLREHANEVVPSGFLMPVAYLWSRTVTCKNPNCAASVPLVRQTWLCKKKGRYVALKMLAPRGQKKVRFQVIEASSESGLGFDPAGFSKGGNASCPYCGAVADIDYVKSEGWDGRLGFQMMAVACVSSVDARAKVYVSADDIPGLNPNAEVLVASLNEVKRKFGLTVPNEQIAGLPASSRENSLGITVRPYGIRTFGDLFILRQQVCLLTFAAMIREAEKCMGSIASGHREAVLAMLACFHDRLVDFSSTCCVWNCLEGERTAHTFGRHAISMTWDFSETNPFNPANAGWPVALERIIPAIESVDFRNAGVVLRGSATSLPWGDESIDTVITDPPYYDNVPYADISDFFYVWLKRTVAGSFPTHFASTLTPKKTEAIADAGRHEGSWDKAEKAYEHMMLSAFKEAHRVLKAGGNLTIVYAHKTTLGWATLVDALRRAGFTVSEAWPLETEKPGRLRAQASAALASSIFLVARKRNGAVVGNYEEQVKGELEHVVSERVETLWAMGISGADLVIACVGAGLRAFTRFSRVEYANGEEVPAERFLAEVETAVLETILGKLSKTVGAKSEHMSLMGLDSSTRFYILWRYTYGAADLEAGEAIIFANGTHVELDGQHGLTQGSRALLEKKKSKYRLRDYSERGDEKTLGERNEDGNSAPTVDALHKILWLVEHRPLKVPEFLNEAKPNIEELRLVAQALGGPALKGGELADVSPTGEQSAIGKLLANWSAVMVGRGALEDRRAGQERLL